MHIIYNIFFNIIGLLKKKKKKNKLYFKLLKNIYLKKMEKSWAKIIKKNDNKVIKKTIKKIKKKNKTIKYFNNPEEYFNILHSSNLVDIYDNFKEEINSSCNSYLCCNSEFYKIYDIILNNIDIEDYNSTNYENDTEELNDIL